MKRALLAAALTLAVAACGTTAVRPEARLAEWREAAERGDSAARLQLVEALASRGGLGALAEARRHAEVLAETDHAGAAWAARLAEVLGDTSAAFDRAVALTADPRAPAPLRAWAALRALALVDRVPLGAAHLARIGAAVDAAAPPETAELLEAVALRLPASPTAASALTRAREALGAVRSYRRTGRLARRPATDLVSVPPQLGPPEAGESRRGGAFGPPIATPDGTVAFAEDGPGVYSATFEAPADARALVVWGTASFRAWVDGHELGLVDRLGDLAPERASLAIPPPTRGATGPRRVELMVADRDAAISVRVFARPDAPAVDRPLAGAPILSRLVALERALAAADVPGLTVAVHALDEAGAHAAPAAAVASALLADPTRPRSLAAAEAQEVLTRALALDPENAEARALLVRSKLAASAPAEAEALAAAGPLGDHAGPMTLALALEAGEQTRAGTLAEREVARVPSSCEAWSALLEARWEALKVRADAIPAALPRCFPLALQAAVLDHEAFRLDAARARLDALLAAAPPGRPEANVRLARARVALAAGRTDDARADAREGLSRGVLRESMLDVLLGLAQLERDAAAVADARRALLTAPTLSLGGRKRALDVRRDLGLPLTDGAALAEAAVFGDAPGHETSVHHLLEERHTTVLPGGAMVHRVHRVIHLLDDAAVEELGEMAVPDEAEILVARTFKPTPDGRLQPIEPEDFLEKTSISLPALEPGAVVEVAWFWLEAPSARVAPHFAADPFLFDSERGAVAVARYILRTDPEASLRVEVFGDVAPPATPSPGVRVWTASDSPRALPEPLDARPERRRRSVRVSSDFDLAELRAAFVESLAPRIRVTPVIEDLARAALAGVARDAPRARLAALYARTLDHVTEGQGDPFLGSASLTAAGKSGDRAALLVALCAAAGLRCDLALARPWTRGDPATADAVESGPVDFEDFIYPLVRADLGGEVIWLDPSSRFVPFGLMSPVLEGADALVVRAGDGLLVEAVPRRPEHHGERRITARLTIGADRRLSAEGRETLTGFQALGWRHVLADLPAESRDRILAGVVQQSLPGVVVGEVTLEGLGDRDAPLRFLWTATGELPAPSRPTGARSTAPALTAFTLGLSPERIGRSTVVVAERRTPLWLAQVGRLDMTVELELPEGASFHRPPAAARVAHPLMTLVREVTGEAGGRTLTVAKRYDLTLGRVDPADYVPWARAAMEVDRADVVHLEIRWPDAGDPK